MSNVDRHVTQPDDRYRQESDVDHDRQLALAQEHADVLTRLEALDAIVGEYTQRRLQIEALLDRTVDRAAEARAKATLLEATDFELRIAGLVLPPSTVVVRFSDGSGTWASLTDAEVGTCFDALKDLVGLGRLEELPFDNSDLTLEECIRDGEHGWSLEPDGTCTYCGTVPR